MENKDIIKTVWRWRWKIGVFVLTATLASLLLSFLLIPKYFISAVVEPGIWKRDNTGTIQYVETSTNISQKINSNSYLFLIVDKFNLNPAEANRLKIYADSKRDTLAVHITLKHPDPEKGTQILTYLCELLENAHSKDIENIRKGLDRQIVAALNQARSLETDREYKALDIERTRLEITNFKAEQIRASNEIEQKEKSIDTLQAFTKETQNRILLNQKRVTALEKELPEIRKTIGTLRTKIYNTLQKKGQHSESTMEEILLLNYLQEESGSYNEIDTQLHEIRKDIERDNAQIIDYQNQIAGLKIEIGNIKLERDTILQSKIDDKETSLKQIKLQVAGNYTSQIELKKDYASILENEKDLIYPLKIISEPAASPAPVWPPKLAIVIGTFILSFCIGVFFASCAGYFNRLIRIISEENTAS